MSYQVWKVTIKAPAAILSFPLCLSELYGARLFKITCADKGNFANVTGCIR